MLEFYSSYVLYVSYGQISVFNYGIENPYSDWSPDHIAQGFTLREGAIGIATINSYGKIKININLSQEISKDAIRVFILPFCVKGGKGIQIASITEEFSIKIVDGDYSVIGLVRQPGWLSHKSCNFSPLRLRNYGILAEVVRKLKFPNNSIIQIGNIDSENDWCNLSFIKSTEISDTPRILKADSAITERVNLLLTAYPA